MTKDLIVKALKKETDSKEIHLEHPELEAHGDYSSNIALVLAKARKKSPIDLAQEFVKKLEKDTELTECVSKIEVAKPGFINLWLSEKYLLDNLREVVEKGDRYGSSKYLKGKSILLEHTSPNTIKTLHVGHVRNNVLGMAVHNILEFTGAKVALDAINNDKGIHVMKAVWAYQKYGKGKSPGKKKTDQFVDTFYVKGAKEAEDEKNKEQMQELLRAWEAGDKEIRAVWKKLRDWTFEGFRKTYQRLRSRHDHQWFESDFYEEGKKIVEEGLVKKVFKKLDDGAVLTQLDKFKLPDTIVMRADGTSMYHTQDLRLTQLKREKFSSDLYIWDVGPEQSLYLKQLFALCEQLGIGKRDDYLHMSFGFVFLKSGEKMSSRKGNVVSADWLMEEIVKKSRKIVEKSKTPRLRSGQAGSELTDEEKNKIAEAVGIGAIKYGFLRPARETDIYFDMKSSLSLEGNSGPYLQYTVARINSVLAKTKAKNHKLSGGMNFNKEELGLLRLLPRFSGVIIDAAKNYSPNLVCNYLYDLAKKYNSFYNQHKIIGSKEENIRILISNAVGQVLQNGLGLLGIETPERM